MTTLPDAVEALGDIADAQAIYPSAALLVQACDAFADDVEAGRIDQAQEFVALMADLSEGAYACLRNTLHPPAEAAVTDLTALFPDGSEDLIASLASHGMTLGPVALVDASMVSGVEALNAAGYPTAVCFGGAAGYPTAVCFGGDEEHCPGVLFYDTPDRHERDTLMAFRAAFPQWADWKITLSRLEACAWPTLKDGRVPWLATFVQPDA